MTTFWLLLVLVLMLIGLPLVGVALAGKSMAPYLAFPPAAAFVSHSAFSWAVFAVLSALVVISVGPLLWRVLTAQHLVAPAGRPRAPFPWWGWLGIAIVTIFWWLAWNRFPWAQPLQRYTFSPLWLGYILVVNALTYKRTGGCMLANRRGHFLALFPLSAGFWWLFEYLNRFVHNWYYVGVSELGPWEYFWEATLPFSTVLPAVLGTRELIASYPRLHSGVASFWAVRLPASRLLAWLTLSGAGIGLAAIGVWPEQLFALLWLAPLMIITALQALLGEKTIIHPIAQGDWSALWQAALAGLICGVFWELWNYKSLAHWEYSVPFVQCFELFHMPLLGYAGYFPFGLECLAVASVLERAHLRAEHRRQTRAP